MRGVEYVLLLLLCVEYDLVPDCERVPLLKTGVRVERLQDISESDCWSEGVEEVMNNFDDISQIEMAKRLGCCIEDAKPLYAQLWEKINGPGSWDANPWVWCVEFKRFGEEVKE